MLAAVRVRLKEYEAAEDMPGVAMRKSIKRALRTIRKGKVPFGWDERYGATDILAPVLKQFDAAFKAAIAAERQASRRH
jgi:hypothetical protein